MAAAGPQDVKSYPDNYTFFWHKESPFSQWHPAKFTVDGVLYNCAEQYMMHQKAVLQGDLEIADQVMKTENPMKQKKLGKKVKKIDQGLWDVMCIDVVKRGNINKFGQNEMLKQILLDTEGTTLVEASPFDQKWGIGLEATHVDAQNKSTWRGKNLLGYALTDVREQLLKTDPARNKAGEPNPADYPKTYTFFWRNESPFSQWHLAEFEINGVKYNCTEQYMMYQKALMMQDEHTAAKVLKTPMPIEQKALGRKVKNFDDDLWSRNSYDIVKTGNFHKFTQNEELRKVLLDTAGTTLVEASPLDKVWGIGLAEDDPKAMDYRTWEGRNLLGFALTDVREQIRTN